MDDTSTLQDRFLGAFAIKIADHVLDRAVERTNILPAEVRALRAQVALHRRRGTLDPNKDYRYTWRGDDGHTRGYAVIGPVPHPTDATRKLHVVKTILSPGMQPPHHELPALAAHPDTPTEPATKEAATRQVRELRRLHAAGDIEGVRNLASQLYQSGVQKDTPAGIQVHPSLQRSTLGRGLEGTAVEVFGPNGVEVRKQYDPRSPLWSRELREDKARLFQAAAANPETQGSFAKLYAAHEAPYQAIHRMERVYGNELHKHPAAGQVGPKLDALEGHLDRTAQAAGLAGHRDTVYREPADPLRTQRVNQGNVFVEPSGNLKAIDVLPTRAEPAHGVQLAPGHGRPVQGLGAYFPNGIDLRSGYTPDVELARGLGPGSRQAKKTGVGIQAFRAKQPAPVAATAAHAFSPVIQARTGMSVAHAPMFRTQGWRTAASLATHPPGGLVSRISRAVPTLANVSTFAF